MTVTLGINAAFHDSAAALVIDGVPVAAAEEERFTRIKHAKRPVPFWAWELPFHAVDFCLQRAGLTMADIDHVADSFDPRRFADGRSDLRIDSNGYLPLHLPREAGPAASSATSTTTATLAPWDSPWSALFMAEILAAPGQLADGAPHHLRQRLAPGRQRWQWQFVDHHLCHQASAFLAAPQQRFAHCAVMTLDGRGERATTSYGVWHAHPGDPNNQPTYRSLGEVEVPHSLGLLYERVTTHLGFLYSSDEYKVMALAAMGQPRWGDVLADHVQVGRQGQLRVDEFDLTSLAGPPRQPGSTLAQQHLDLAASLQQVLERTVLQLASWLREASGAPALAMAGGVALNCVMNAKLRDAGPFADLWVQPAAGDAGTALGAALWVDSRERRGDHTSPDGSATVNARGIGGTGGTGGAGDIGGSRSSGADVGAADSPERRSSSAGASWQLAPRRWQMDHAYLGPEWSDDEIEPLLRWSGLAFERLDDDAALVERAAALLADQHIIGWFQGRMEWGPRALGARSILASPIDPRMQAPRFHALLQAFGRRTGVPVLVNTSFNVRGQPVVCSPRDALEAFFTTPLQALVIGRFVLLKAGADQGAGRGASTRASAGAGPRAGPCAGPSAGPSAVPSAVPSAQPYAVPFADAGVSS